MKYQVIYGIGKMIDEGLKYVAIIAVVLGVIGFIIEATWAANAGMVVLYVLAYSGIWFLFVLFFLMAKVKQERSESVTNALMKAKRDAADAIAKLEKERGDA